MKALTRKQAEQLMAEARRRGRRVQGELPAPEKRANKYNAKPVTTEDGHFDSTLEYRRWLELKRMRRAGQIKNLRHHVIYRLVVQGVHVANYEADAVYWRDGRIIVEDSKGVRTAVYKLKKRLMLAVHGIAISEYPPKQKKPRTKRRLKNA